MHGPVYVKRTHRFFIPVALLAVACSGDNQVGGGLSPGASGNGASGVEAGSGGRAGGTVGVTGGSSGVTAGGVGVGTPGGANAAGAPPGEPTAGMGGNTTAGMGGNATAGMGGNATAGMGGVGTGGAINSAWSTPTSLISDLGRLAIGNQVHVVGHSAGQLVHRTSANNGSTWGAPTVIASASGNYPAMYGGLVSDGNNVYLITADANMDSSADSGGRQLDFRKSGNNGAAWSPAIRITTPATPIFRARVAAQNNYVHVVGTSMPTGDASVWYFRSVDGGTTWSPGVPLATNLGKYGGGQTVAADGATVHVAYTTVVNGVGAGPTLYIRSTDNGGSWSQPVPIGENTAESNRQARVQLAAADGKVFACWQREAVSTGAPIPADRIGYNRSVNGGQSWGTAKVLPEGSGIDRNHQHVWMAPGGGVHVIWRHGDSGDNTPDPAGYMSSPDYGASWGKTVMAIDTTSTIGANHPWSIVANATAVHVLTGPDGNMQYGRRLLP